jgi:hypothetical protein
MASELGVAFQAAGEARSVQKRINAAGPMIPEIQERGDVVAAINGKNVFTPLFYSYANYMSQHWMPQTDINVPKLNDIGGAIIIIDEIAERMSARELNCQPCIDRSLVRMGLNMDITAGSATYHALEDMYTAMQQEREYAETRLSYEQYRQAVGHSIGMTPFYASVAEAHQEADIFTAHPEGLPDARLQLLHDLEFVTRVLSDDITLGKDLKNKSLNIITEYHHFHQELSLEQVRNLLRDQVVGIIGTAREQITGVNSPTLSYALNFVEVLENVARLDDPRAKRSQLLGVMGSLIATFIYRADLTRQQANPGRSFKFIRKTFLKMRQLWRNHKPAVGLVSMLLVIILMVMLSNIKP